MGSCLSQNKTKNQNSNSKYLKPDTANDKEIPPHKSPEVFQIDQAPVSVF